jgi:hypothetical protein
VVVGCGVIVAVTWVDLGWAVIVGGISAVGKQATMLEASINGLK